MRKVFSLIGLIILIAVIVFLRFYNFSGLNRHNPSYADENYIVVDHNSKEAKYSDIDVNVNGDGVITWQHRNKDWDIYAQRIKNGKKIGDVIKVNQYSLYNQQFPKVAVDKDGDFVIVWQSYFQGGAGTDVYAQRFNSEGKKIRNEFRLHSDVKFNQLTPDVAMRDDGSFAVTWVSEEGVMKGGVTTYFKNIFIKFFNKYGRKLNEEQIVNTNDYELNTNPVIAVDSSGETMVAWQAFNNGNWDIYAQSFDAKGIARSSRNTLVNFNTINDQTHPSITATSSGNFLVVWVNKQVHKMFDRLMENIAGQKLNKNGGKSGFMFTVNDPELACRNTNPSVSSNGETSVVVWQSYKDSQWKVLYQFLDKNNNLIGDVNELTDIDQFDKIWELNPTTYMDSNGYLNTSWTQLNLDGNNKSVLFTTIEPLVTPTASGESL